MSRASIRSFSTDGRQAFFNHVMMTIFQSETTTKYMTLLDIVTWWTMLHDSRDTVTKTITGNGYQLSFYKGVHLKQKQSKA